MSSNSSEGISLDKVSFETSDFNHAHRDDGHTFHIIEKGSIRIEIDFQKYIITAPAVVYMHPHQVHRILHFKNITVCSLSIKDESMNQEYLALLEEISPAKPLKLNKETNGIVGQLFNLCINFYNQKSNKLYYPLLKDSCNTLVAFLIAQFLHQNKSAANPSRFEVITKAFRRLLDQHYTTSKRPAEYAAKLNISVAYLNECVKHTTGFSASQYIQDRIILEAKRLLYHSIKSVKEIAFELGYDDQQYFSRTFTKATGMSALAFRNKNHD